MSAQDSYILSVDQGTSGTKALVFNQKGQVVTKASVPLKTLYKEGNRVEQEPEKIYKNVLKSVAECLAKFRKKGFDEGQLLSCGISNQRETFLVWDETGRPLYNAVVWQCKCSVQICERLKKAGLEKKIRERTGLIIDPYFSGTKLIWLYENVPRIKAAIDAGKAYFGTVDTWLLYRLTKGQQYLTDYTNASRTLFFNLQTLKWDWELIKELGLDGVNLPEVQASSSSFGESDFGGLLKERIPISAMIGDSQAAAFGEGCFSPGTAKATMGTGCSIMMNVGQQLKKSGHGMVSTICWSTEDRIDYALEGLIVTCGATVEWLKNQLGIIGDSSETQVMAQSLKGNQGVYLIPAFSGLGAPHWDMNRKASITGLSLDSNKNHIVRAALESIPYQIMDVISAMELDAGIRLDGLSIDGGISVNRFVTQFLSDLLERPVVHFDVADVSALGAGYLAGLKVGVYKDLDHLKSLQQKNVISPHSESRSSVQEAYRGWKQALDRN